MLINCSKENFERYGYFTILAIAGNQLQHLHKINWRSIFTGLVIMTFHDYFAL